MFESEGQEKSSGLFLQGSILQVVPLSFAATTSTLLLVLSTYSEIKMNQPMHSIKASSKHELHVPVGIMIMLSGNISFC
jgi:hypothetical protein